MLALREAVSKHDRDGATVYVTCRSTDTGAHARSSVLATTEVPRAESQFRNRTEGLGGNARRLSMRSDLCQSVCNLTEIRKVNCVNPVPWLTRARPRTCGGLHATLRDCHWIFREKVELPTRSYTRSMTRT